MKKFILLLFLISITIYISASFASWSTLNQDPYQVYSLSSIFNYSSVFVNDAGLNEEIIFDYNKKLFCSLQNEYGKIGFFIQGIDDTLLDKYMMEIFYKTINPVEFGILFAKKIKKINLGIKINGFSFNESYSDINSVYNDILSQISFFSINPSISFFYEDKILLEVSPTFGTRNCKYDDYIVLNQSEYNTVYSINARFINFIGDNKFIVYSHYSSFPYSYSKLSKSPETIDNYSIKNDSLKFGFLAQIESFNYVKSYLGINYSSININDRIIYNNGSIIENKYNRIISPSLNAGFSFYINRYINFNSGLSSSWINETNKNGTSLNIENTTNSFELNYNFGLSFLYNDLKIDFNFSKDIIQIPFFISGNNLNNIDIGFGFTYQGFEY